MYSALSIFLFCTLLFHNAKGYFVTVDAHAEECFFENLEADSTFSLIFEISEGGFLDIDVRITGPDQKEIHKVERETSGQFTFAAHIPGPYNYCFSNKMSTMTPKVVLFNVEVAKPRVHSEKNADGTDVDHDKLEDMITQLSNSLKSVKRDQEYMTIRDRIHRQINESTNSRVVLWTLFEALVVLVMALGLSNSTDLPTWIENVRSQRYAVTKDVWRKLKIKYKVIKYSKRIDDKVVDSEIERAFLTWSSASQLDFQRSVNDSEADILIGFEKRFHGDAKPFDGSGVTLAHAFYPIFIFRRKQMSFIHFDDSEKWTVNSTIGINFFQVAVHEIGHALGLKHSNIQESVMWPNYIGYIQNFTLHKDDLDAIHILYGFPSKDHDGA